jgi:hypothetical protein
MPGHNHYSWCMCGWCFKTGANGYSLRDITAAFDKSYANRTLREHGADKSWTACFVNPNASCPVCFRKVYYYQNEHGSRVFFDELGWPWPKHPCTDNARTAPRLPNSRGVFFEPRKRGIVAELMDAAAIAEFDPNANFRNKYGHSPFDLVRVSELNRSGFRNFIKAESLSPALDEPVYLSFDSAKMIPSLGDYFSFNGTEVSFLNPETLRSHDFKATEITAEAFTAEASGARA